MLKLIYKNEKKEYEISFKRISENVVEISGDFTVKTVGFDLYKMNNVFLGDYADFVTIYREFEDGTIQFSNDESVYVAPPEPEPLPEPVIPEPEPYVPTLDDIKMSKRGEIEWAYQSAYMMGVDVTMADETVVHIDRIDSDLILTLDTAYSSAITLIDTPDIMIPFDINGVCSTYSPIDIVNFYIAVQSFVIYNKSLRNDLLGTIERCEDMEVVKAIAYAPESLDEAGMANFTVSVTAGQNVITAIKAKFNM